MAKNKIERIDQEIAKTAREDRGAAGKAEGPGSAENRSGKSGDRPDGARPAHDPGPAVPPCCPAAWCPAGRRVPLILRSARLLKNKKIFRTFAALCTCLMLMGGFSVTAFAQGADPAPTATPAADATNDSNVVVEETEDSPALTPEGNAALVDDFGGNKQLITVTTKAGNYFYILIDRANEDKETAVHFLNQVDEADLKALMEDGETAEETPATCNCTEKCVAGAVNTACPVCAVNMAGCTGQEPEPTPAPETEPEPEAEPAGLNPAFLLVVLAALGGIGALVYFKFIKQKSKTKGSDNLDDYDYGADEELPEDETWETEPEEADGGGDEESENPVK